MNRALSAQGQFTHSEWSSVLRQLEGHVFHITYDLQRKCVRCGRWFSMEDKAADKEGCRGR